MKIQFEADFANFRDYFDNELDIGFRIAERVNVAPFCGKRVLVTIQEIPDNKVSNPKICYAAAGVA